MCRAAPFRALRASRLSLFWCHSAPPFLLGSRGQQTAAACQPSGRRKWQGDAAVGRQPGSRPPRCSARGPASSPATCLRAFGLCPALAREGAQRRRKLCGREIRFRSFHVSQHIPLDFFRPRRNVKIARRPCLAVGLCLRLSRSPHVRTSETALCSGWPPSAGGRHRILGAGARGPVAGEFVARVSGCPPLTSRP